MKRTFKKSYKLGISAGILSGLVVGMLSFLLYIFYGLQVAHIEHISLTTFFFFNLLINTIIFIILGTIFIALINVLPSANIYVKFFILNLAALIVFSPLAFLSYGLTIFIIVDALFNVILNPLVYSFFYMIFAKKFNKIVKFNQASFVLLVGLLLVFLFIGSLASFVTFDVVNLKALQSGVIDESAVETEIFNKINQIRLKFGNKPLIWDDDIYKIAKDYSSQMANKKFFSHVGADESDIIDRFKEKDLFFLIVGENLYMTFKGMKNIANLAVDKWMKSPGHRSMVIDRDKFFTHGAVGVSCDNLYCYVTADLADFDIKGNITLDSYGYYWLNLNDAAFGLKYSYPVDLHIKTTNPIDVYMLDNRDALELFLEDGKSYPSYKKIYTKEISIHTEAKKDSYLLIMNDYNTTTDIDYHLIYNQVGFLSSISESSW